MSLIGLNSWLPWQHLPKYNISSLCVYTFFAVRLKCYFEQDKKLNDTFRKLNVHMPVMLIHNNKTIYHQESLIFLLYYVYVLCGASY